jgi:hypothetical protein
MKYGNILSHDGIIHDTLKDNIDYTGDCTGKDEGHPPGEVAEICKVRRHKCKGCIYEDSCTEEFKKR